MKEFSIGIKRFKDLDEATANLAQGNEQASKGFINSFIGTIDGNSNAAKILKEEFDKIHGRRKDEHRDLDKRIEDIGFLEQSVGSRQGHIIINTLALQDIIETCWRIGREEGLFHD